MTDQRATTIRLFLAEGSPDGVWVIEKSNWTGLGLMAPRSRYAVLRQRPEMAGPGVYVLVGPAEGGAKANRIYIGETDVLKDRLDLHQKRKDFWTRVVIFTAKDANLNKAHVRYLESRLQVLAVDANRAELDNTTSTSLPALSEADRADMEAFLDDMLLIYPVVGLNAFERAAADEPGSPGHRLYLKAKDTDAEGREIADGFVAYEGSLGRRDSVPSLHQHTRDLREQLEAEKVFAVEGDHLRLTEDYVFGSPSGAAAALLGRTSNGRREWKDEAGISLMDLQAEEVGAEQSEAD